MFEHLLMRGLDAWRRSRLGPVVAPIAATSSSDLFRRTADQRLLLHVGCGQADISALPAGFQSGFREIRVDLDPEAQPDIVASLADLAPVPAACVDAVFSSHVLEHLPWHEVPPALAECRRVLRDDGFVVLTLPDAQEIARWVADDRLLDVAYTSPAGAITPLDMLWGHVTSLANGKVYMQHKCGFTLRTLNDAVRAAGFAATFGFRRPVAFDLWLLACPQPTDEAQLRALAKQFLAPH